MAAKFEGVPTVALDPARLYPYAIERMRESKESHSLRLEGATLDHARMMGAPDVAAALGWLIRLTGAKRVIEVGTFRGSTTLWIAEALPTDGRVVALDVDESFAEVGKKHWTAANVQHKVDLRIAPAADSMKAMLAAGEAGQYDLVFIDADKVNYGTYYELGLQLIKTNGIIAVDNTLWSGRILEGPDSADDNTRSIARLNDAIAADARVDSVLIPLADGLTLVRKL